MKQLLNKTYTPAIALIWNLLLIYLVYTIARLEYYAENISYFDFTIEIFQGGLMFDTSAILYTNALYILLMLIPWHRKENSSYHQICKWLYIIVNSITLAINLADSVYFKYTMRRTTSSVFSEFSNESNLVSIFGRE